MADHELRLGLLAWVQDHFIQRYSDKSVVSHSEGVDELMAIVEANTATIHPIAGEIKPWPKPCSSNMPDGRSEICARCDWPDEAHDKRGN